MTIYQDYLDPALYGVNPADFGLDASNRMQYAGYDLKLVTSSIKDSGTDSMIKIRLYGTGGRTELIEMKNKPHYDETEAGDTDIWGFGPSEVPDVGPVFKIGILVEGTDAWRPDSITVTRKVMMMEVRGAFPAPHIFTNAPSVFDCVPQSTEFQNMTQEVVRTIDIMNFVEDPAKSSMGRSGTIYKVVDLSSSAMGLPVKVETGVELSNEMVDSAIKDFTQRNKVGLAYKVSTQSKIIPGVGPSVNSEFSSDFETELTTQITNTHTNTDRSAFLAKVSFDLDFQPGMVTFVPFDVSSPTQVGTAHWFDGTSTEIAFPDFSGWAMSQIPGGAITVANDAQMTPELQKIYEIHRGPWKGFRTS